MTVTDIGRRRGSVAALGREYMLTSEVAALFAVSPKTVSRWAKEGRLPFTWTLGGHRRYPADKIAAMAEEGVVTPAAPPTRREVVPPRRGRRSPDTS